MHQLKAHLKFAQREPRQLDVLPLTEEVLANSLLPYELGEAACPPYWRLKTAYLERNCGPPWRPDMAR